MAVSNVLMTVLPAILGMLAAIATRSMRAVVRSVFKSPRKRSYIVKANDGEYTVVDAEDSDRQEVSGK